MKIILENFLEKLPILKNQEFAESQAKNWRIKCLDYLVYCLHGGYYPTRLRLFDLMFSGGDKLENRMSNIDYILLALLRLEKRGDSVDSHLNMMAKGLGYPYVIKKFLDGHSKSEYTWNTQVLKLMIRNNYLLNMMHSHLDTYVDFL